MSALPERIHITEVGPRDGLQNLEKIIPTEKKIELVNALSKTGLEAIEVSAFVHPTWIPQLSDADDVFAGIQRYENVNYSALVPNEHGWSRALAAGIDEVAVLAAASETFSERNTNTSIQGALERIEPIANHAIASGVAIRGYISCVIACPYEQQTDLKVVRMIAQQMLDMGISTISLGETLGVALPEDIRRLYDALDGVLSPEESVLHLHNTSGGALDCVEAGMGCGVTTFDTSCGGLGGCPYAPGAAGNLATEDLVRFAQQRGIETGIDFDLLVSASHIIEKELDGQLQSIAYRTFQDAQTRPSE
jgi:hydroxymethylglutaryl-CoA lyase